ncbi:MAG: carboxypeptidase regulatory-like domain-containing protein [Bryobacteraceae bacterium]|nr:carboxypeptidase regulatory-like domain-containing protein [Bryobacteraceae bacterium]
MKMLRIHGLGLWFLLSSGLLAQNAGIQGTVTDGSGAVLVNATVVISNTSTGVTTRYTTNAQGLYIAPSLNAGRYQVECQATGFATQALKGLQLEVGQTARLDFALKPGTVVEAVEVSASAVLLNTETTEVGQVIDGKRILEMPLNGRNYLQLAQFTAGVLPGGGAGAGSRARDEGAFAAVGMQIAQNNVLLDGNDNSSRTSGGPLGFEAQAVKPPVDAVSEFKVVTNNMSAEYGYRAGAKILVNTKSGTNELHGSAYEFLRNQKLDAANFFANRNGAKKPLYQQNQFGATLGGRIIKNRTFFFGSYQGTRIRRGQTFTSSVASRDIVERLDFSAQPAVRRNIFDPLTLAGTGAAATRLPFAGNRIPESRVDPVARQILNLSPASNVAGLDNAPNNYFYSPKDSDNANQYDFRGDHNFSANQRFFARYSRRDQFRNENGSLPAPATGGGGQTVDLQGHNLVASLSSTLGTTLFNELRFGYSKFDTKFDIPFTENLNKKFGIKNAPGDSFGDGQDYGFSLFSPAGFTELGPRAFWPNFNNLDNRMITNSMLWQKGKHTVKFGGEYRRLNVFRNAARYRRGQFSFSGQFTSQQPNNGASRGSSGNGLADMVLGWVSGGNYGNNQGENIVAPYYGAFVQDDWKVNSRLTLNVGVRWEMFPKGTFPNAAKQSVGKYLLAEDRIVFPTSDSDCGCKNDRNNFAPRLGLAYQLNAKTVIRSGAGIFYGEPNSLSTEGANFRSGPPRSQDIAIQTNFEQANVFVRDGFPAFSNTQLLRGASVFVFPDFRGTLYASQWFFDVQRTLPLDTLVTIGYQGTKGTNLHAVRNINQPMTPSATVAANQRLILPQFSAVNYHENSLNSVYHALTVKAEKRFSKGFTFLSSFTWSRNMDYGNEDLLDGSPGAVTPYDLRRERGLSTLNRKFGYAFSGVYEVPTGKMTGPAKWVLGGWQIGGIVSLLTGLPISNSINVNNQNLGGAVRGDWVRNPNLPSSERTIDRWFDTTFAVPAAPGTIANVGRNVIVGPGRQNIDMMISRTFRMPFEGHALQFRFESFNFLNHANFGPPAAGLGTPAVGRITVADDPRRIQFGQKYNF